MLERTFLFVSSRLKRAGRLRSKKRRVGGGGGAAPPFAELPNRSRFIFHFLSLKTFSGD